MSKVEQRFNEALGRKVEEAMWECADDATTSVYKLSELYPDVPKELADVSVREIRYHFIEEKPSVRKKVFKWLNEE